ncbi:hypothetical protein, partial [Dickeya oryzae]
PCPKGPTRGVVQHASVLSCNSNYFGYIPLIHRLQAHRLCYQAHLSPTLKRQRAALFNTLSRNSDYWG